MIDYKLTLDNVTKLFGRRVVFKDLSFTFGSGSIFGIAGHNGSGKSTLTKIIASIISPTRGKIIHKYDDKVIDPDALLNYMGFLSPYLVLYDEFTAQENVDISFKIRGIEYDRQRVDRLFSELRIDDRRDDLLKTYSSGMKQRMRLIFALLHSPKLILLDEPTSNLDDTGKQTFYELIKNEAKNNLVIIASNEEKDLELCSGILNLSNYKENEN